MSGEHTVTELIPQLLMAETKIGSGWGNLLSTVAAALTETAAERDRIRAEVERHQQIRTGLLEHIDALTAEKAELVAALRDILQVITTDELVPESVSYMRQARAALAKATATENVKEPK